MKRYLVAIFILTIAVTTYAKDIRRSMAEKTVATVTPTSAKTHIFGLQSTAQGWDIVRLADDSVLKVGGIDTTAVDGTRIWTASNATDISTTGLTAEDAGLAYFNRSLGKFRYWDGTQIADFVGAASPAPPYDDTLIQSALNERVTTTTHNETVAALNTRIDNLTFRMASLEAAFVAHGGVLAPSAEVSPASLAFGDVNTQNSSSMDVTLTSSGTADLILGTATITGTGAAKYSIESTTCDAATLVTGTTCMAQVMFSPGTAAGGPYTAQLEFPHNATGSPTTVAITGTGVSVSDPAVSFFWDAEGGLSNPLEAQKGGITATNSGLVFNTTTYKTGASSVEKTTNAGTLTFPVTASHVDVGSGSVGFWFNSTNGYAAGTYNNILRVSDASDANRFLIHHHSSGGMQVDWTANGVTSATQYLADGGAKPALQPDTWYYVTFAWNQPNTTGADLSLTIYNEDGSTLGTGAMITSNNIQAWTAEPTTLRLGHAASSAYRFRLDHLVLSDDHTKDMWGIRNAGDL
jgi:hypothetical protein